MRAGGGVRSFGARSGGSGARTGRALSDSSAAAERSRARAQPPFQPAALLAALLASLPRVLCACLPSLPSGFPAPSGPSLGPPLSPPAARLPPRPGPTRRRPFRASALRGRGPRRALRFGRGLGPRGAENGASRTSKAEPSQAAPNTLARTRAQGPRPGGGGPRQAQDRPSVLEAPAAS